MQARANYLGRALHPNRLMSLSAKALVHKQDRHTLIVFWSMLECRLTRQLARRHGSQVALCLEPYVLFGSKPGWIRDFQVQASAHLYARRSALQAAFALHRTKHEACFPETLPSCSPKRTRIYVEQVIYKHFVNWQNASQKFSEKFCRLSYRITVFAWVTISFQFGNTGLFAAITS